MNTTPTPETDALAIKAGITIANTLIWEHARKLERERDSAIQSAKDLAVNFRASEVKRIEVERERDEARTQLDAWQTMYGSRQLSHAISERDQLRKVADAYYLALTDGQLNKAEDAYNQLPHVIERSSPIMALIILLLFAAGLVWLAIN